MKKLSKIATGLMTVITLSAFAGDCPPLSGQYTIGKSETADFTSIGDAVHALQCGGVSTAVTFVLEDGTYEEKIVLSAIPGTSAFNTVSFMSKSGNSSDVIISYGSSDATFVLNGTSNISLENVSISHKNGTYGNAMRVDGKASNIHFKSVVFDGVEEKRAGKENAVVNFTSTAPKTNIIIEDCEINNGSIGLVKGGMDTENPDSKTTVSGTLFFNQFESGMSLSNEDAPVIANNVVTSLSSFENFKALALDNASNTLIVTNNIINAANGSVGLSMNNCSAQATALGQINGNSISVGGKQSAAGILLSGSTDNQVINFNRIKLSINGEPSASQSYYVNSGEGNNINLLNNIFYDLKTGGYTILGNTYKDHFNQLPGQSNPALSASANGIMVEKVTPIK